MYHSLYIHIPFCIHKCVYCDFLSVVHSESLAEDYVDALCQELMLRQDRTGRLDTVFIGGGTPSLLSESCFIKLFQYLMKHFTFSERPEITVEVNPGTVNRSKLDVLRALGVNRISIGAQSFSDAELARLGRNHRSSDTLKTLTLLRASGFKNISIDLIFGTPLQTLNDWRHTITKAHHLSVTHISTYELTPALHTKLYDEIKSHRVALPDEQSIVDMYNYAIDRLGESGFHQYEISNFAMFGFECTHNLNYWNRGDYAGMGAGAHSFLSGIRLKNTDNIRSYMKGITSGVVPQSEAAELKENEHIQECIFLGLRKTEGLSLSGLNLSDYPVLDACSEFFDNGFMEIHRGAVRLTRKGLPVANTIITGILKKLDIDS